MRLLRARRLVRLAYRRRFDLTGECPIVTFSFDDFPRSAYFMGGKILKDEGARGTYYAAMGLMNTTGALGDMFRVEDLHALSADGHEVASHTFHHLSAGSADAAAFVDDALAGHEALRNVPGLSVSGNFAYPYGAASIATKRVLSRKMLSCRSGHEGVNRRQVDLGLLRANSLEGDLDQLDMVRRLLDESERLQGWVIFYTHDVSHSPSPYGCTPELLEAAVKLARTRSMRIVTVEEALAGARACEQAEGWSG